MWAALGIIWNIVNKVSWKVWVILVIIVIVSFLSIALHHKNIVIQKQAQQITALTSAITQEKREIINYKNAIDIQNNQITAFLDRTRQDGNKINELTATLNNVQVAQKTKINELKNEPPPKNCDDMIQYLQNNIKELIW